MSSYKIYARLLKYIKKYAWAFAIALIASAIYAGVDAWFVYFLKPLLNKGLVAKDSYFITWVPLLVLVVFLMRGIASFFSTYFMAYVARRLVMELRQNAFAHMLKLPAKYYDQTMSGKLLSHITYNIEQVADASADALSIMVQSSCYIIGLLVVMFSISIKLSLLYFITLPIIAAVVRISSRRIMRLSTSLQESMANIVHVTEENIEGYKVVRTFGGQEYEQDKFNKAVKVNRGREMKAVTTKSVSISAVQLIAASALAITLFLATSGISGSLLSAGGFVSIIAAMLALLKPMKDLTRVNNKIHRGLAGAKSVFNLLDEPIEEDRGQKSILHAKGKIKFRNVSFAYGDNKTILHNISFTAMPGEVIALVGRSGSGKTTMVNLLPRFYTGYDGQILIDDIEINNYKLNDLRQQFSIVSQHVTLFNDTVFANIAYGVQDVSPADVEQAATAAHALDFIKDLPAGFDTMIGENGVLLSGGQRQRLAIARAILKDAPIIILDEATSSLDTEAERHIQLALDELMKNRTTLVIAHRLSTVEHADKIIVLDQGRIVEESAHKDLLAQDGYYAKLYKLQYVDSPFSRD